MSVKAVVLGAGKGTRMKSDKAKVLHEVAGRPLILWMLQLLDDIHVDETVVVVGHQADSVAEILPDGTGTALQADQLGTGHATQIGLGELVTEPGDTVIVLPGDMPLIRTESLAGLVAAHRNEEAAATVAAQIEDSGGEARSVRTDTTSEAITDRM